MANRFTEWLFATKELITKSNSRVGLPKAPTLSTDGRTLVGFASRSELVYSCIEKKAQAACDPVLIIEERTGDGEWKPLKQHRALDVLNKPNPQDDWESFFRTWIASENVTDLFYSEIVRNGAGEPINLYPLRPDWITPQYVSSPKGDVLSYYSYIANGIEVRFQPEELLIHRRHSLGSVYAGVSPLAVALNAVDADISATEYVRAFYNNDGTPSGILKITGKNLSDEEAARIKQKWMATYSRNGKGRGSIAILDASADYSPIGSMLDNLDNETLTSIDEARICMAFGVPPVLIGAYVGLRNVNQKASFKGALEDFWMNTMSPELKVIRQFLTYQFLAEFEPERVQQGTLRFGWDMSEVAALQDDVDAIHDRTALGYKTGIYTLDEAREAVNLKPVGGEEGAAFYKPSPSVALPAEPDNPDEQTELDKQLTTRNIRGVLLGLPPVDDEKKNEYRRELSAAEQATDINAIVKSYEQGTKSLTQALLSLQSKLIKQAAEVVGDLPDGELHTLTLVPPPSAYTDVRKQLERSVAEGRRQIAKDAKSFVFPLECKQQSLTRILDLTITRVVQHVTNSTVDIVATNGLLGVDRDDIDDMLFDEFGVRSSSTIEMIARQSTISAVNEGRREEMDARAEEITMYEYSAILDSRVCDECESWDGKQEKDLDDLPETPNPDCEGGANCRCFIIAIFEEGQ